MMIEWRPVGPGTFKRDDDDEKLSDQELLEQALRELTAEQSPVSTPTLGDPSKNEDAGVMYQRCGGGRRVLRKRIGGG